MRAAPDDDDDDDDDLALRNEVRGVGGRLDVTDAAATEYLLPSREVEGGKNIAHTRYWRDKLKHFCTPLRQPTTAIQVSIKRT